jgi:hypothetical protein
MARNEYVIDGHSYVVEVDAIEVTGFSMKPDPNWTYLDRAGHLHDHSRALLITVQDNPDDPPFYFDEDGEEYNAPDHLECSICHEHIDPGLIPPSPYREFIQGMTRYYRDGEPITPEEYAAAFPSGKL